MKLPLTPTRRILSLALGLALLSLNPTAQAASYTWDPTLAPTSPAGGTGTWNSSNTNWSTGSNDQAWTDTTGASDIAVFGGSAGTVTLGSNEGALGLIFNTTGYTLSSGTLTLGSNGINAGSLSSGSTTIASAVVLSGAQTWAVGSGATLVGSGVISGSGGLTKIGSGTLTLSGLNTYTGTTAVNYGTLSLTGSLSSTALSLGGGTFSFDKAGTNSMTFATTTVNSGQSAVKVTVAGNTLDLGALTYSGTGGGVNFSTGTGTIKASLANTNGILGAWATTGNSGGAHAIGDFAANDGNGNIITYTGYTGISTSGATSQTLSASTATQNWKTSNATSSADGNGYVTTLTNSGTLNSLVVQGDVIVGSNNTLTLASGGLILSGISRWIKGPNGNSSDSAMLTTGLPSGELFVDVPEADASANNWRIWTKIVNNGSTAVSVVKNGPGLLELANANTYTGNTYVNGGSLAVGITNALGTSGTLYLNGATLTNGGAGAQVNLVNNIVVSGNSAIQITNNGGVQNFQLTGTLSGSGVLTYGNDGNNMSMYTALTNLMSSGTISLANQSTGNVVRIQTANFGNANVAWVFNNTGSSKDNLEFNGGTISFGSMTGAGYLTGNAGTSTQTVSVGNLGYNDTFSGIINQNTGDVITLQKVGSGTLTLTGANAFTGGVQLNGGKINVGSSGAINNTGAISFGGGALQYSAANQTDYSSRFSTAAGQAYSVDTNGQTVTWATALTSSGGTLTKSGSGTLILSATSTYGGLTTLSSGSMRLTGVLSSSGTVSLGAATLQGSGSAGTLVVNNSGAVIANGNGVAGNTSTLTLGALTFNNAGTFTLNKVNDTTTAAIAITGTLTTASGITLNIPTAPTWTNGQTYDLISYGGFSGNASDIVKGTIAGLGARQSATVGSTGAGSGFITLAIAGDTPYWTGAESNKWTLTSGTGAKNWKLVTAQTATDFLSNDQVLFDDNATGSTTVNISDANVGAAAVTFNNATKTYTISSTGGYGIANGSAAASLNVLGTGTVTLATTNSYTGVTTISAGKLQLGDGTTNGDISTSSGIVNNASLEFNRTVGSSFTYGNVISGTGNVTLSGSGTQILTGANSYSGSTTINSGTLQLGNGGTTGSLSASGTINNNSVLIFNRSNTITQSSDFGTIAGSGSVIQSGSGTTVLANANSYSGGTLISAGSINASNNSALGTGTVTINGGALNNGSSSSDIFIGNNIVVGSSGGSIGFPGTTNFTLSGTISGAGNLNLNSGGAVSSLNWNFAANTMTSGTVTTGNGNTVFRFNSYGATSSALDWVLNNNSGGRGNMLGVNTSGTYSFGSLAGSGLLQGNFQSSSVQAVLAIGGNNHDGNFSGQIFNNGPTLSVLKVGSGTETFSGANGYSGGTTLNAGALAFSNNSAFGSGTVTLNGGTLKAAGGNTIGNNIAVAGSAVYDQASNNTAFSGALSGTGALTMNNSGNASTLTLSGSNAGFSGTFTVNNNNAVSFTSANAGSANAAWVFNDTNVDRVRINISGTNTLNFGSISGGGQIQNDTTSSQTTLSVGALNTSGTFSGTINNGVGILALTKVGTGTQTLTGASTYSGTTNISAGTLALGVGGSLNGTVSVNVASGATFDVTAVNGFTVGSGKSLGGAGTVSGAVTVGANGTLVANNTNFTTGALTLSGTSTFALSINTALGTSSKVTASSLSLDSSNTAVLTITDTGVDTALAVGTKFAFLDYSGSAPVNMFSYTGTVNGSTGTFVLSSGDQIALGSNLYTFNYSDTDNSFNAVTLTAAAVPEPSTWAMLLSGVGMLSFWQRSRRKSA